ncbi:basic proline-rich protein-like [Vulpes lagopus]|uniref:basic proline-rich protein-like n=1 Tax=Vulpes lagopus TaxID=494514 RepID=UPI001BC94F33|nr:basic proline-rich protein-like [Vulpes lagopus]
MAAPLAARAPPAPSGAPTPGCAARGAPGAGAETGPPAAGRRLKEQERSRRSEAPRVHARVPAASGGGAGLRRLHPGRPRPHRSLRGLGPGTRTRSPPPGPRGPRAPAPAPPRQRHPQPPPCPGQVPQTPPRRGPVSRPPPGPTRRGDTHQPRVRTAPPGSRGPETTPSCAPSSRSRTEPGSRSRLGLSPQEGGERRRRGLQEPAAPPPSTPSTRSLDPDAPGPPQASRRRPSRVRSAWHPAPAPAPSPVSTVSPRSCLISASLDDGRSRGPVKAGKAPLTRAQATPRAAPGSAGCQLRPLEQ